ncbi:hypothetical protein HO173_001464 [Letharia columbiana]|uniref:Uncharacterized protein n=1 Tax=Letharia columbiana TaxID=112416 RepID=A0A8H6G5K2_9LECA|nr:uncharacterized protein HO173_001464 [Letharia columbiana]KAF6240791.1 hypothetical protein HO173_001464 [Letharia columbiana]
MSSSQPCGASSKEIHDNVHRLALEQTSPLPPHNSIDSLENNGQMALAFDSSNRGSRAENRTCLEPKREQVLTATLNDRPAGRLCELSRGSTCPEDTNLPGAHSRLEHNVLSHDSRINPPEVLAIEHTNRTARATSKSKHKTLGAVATSQLHLPNRTTGAAVGLGYRPLGQQSNAGSGDDACLAAAARNEFQEQMLRVPAEVCQMIMDMVFDEAFGPRRVHPHKDPPITNIFLALDTAFHRRFHEQYWTKNTWVISKGPLNKTMRFMTEKPYNETTTEFSLQTPNKAALQIRRAELSFSNADAPARSGRQTLADQSAAAPPIDPRHSGPVATQAQRSDDTQRQLVHTWQDKFDRVAMLNLRHLTLDFTEAYGPGGLYLGVYLVRRLIPFAHGMPADFRIVAPDGWLERQIRNAFLALNAR